jgi:hypothetical protein
MHLQSSLLLLAGMRYLVENGKMEKCPIHCPSISDCETKQIFVLPSIVNKKIKSKSHVIASHEMFLKI